MNTPAHVQVEIWTGKVPANEYTHVKKVIGVVSGKGGGGENRMVTLASARMMREQGYSVGILDADITGPSIPEDARC